MVHGESWGILMELTPKQNTFLSKLWACNPALIGSKSFYSLLFTYIHTPLIIAFLYWYGYNNGPSFILLSIQIWLWGMVILGSVGIYRLVRVAKAAILSNTLDERREFDKQLLSKSAIRMIHNKTDFDKTYNLIMSAILFVLLIMIGEYWLALSLFLLRLLGEYSCFNIKKYVEKRLFEVSGNLYMY